MGLHEAGWDGIFAAERDPMAFETLHANLVADDAPFDAFQKWPDWLEKRPMGVEELLAGENLANLEGLRGKVTLVAGGPPCQGFSVGGRRNGQDDRNGLVQYLLDVVEAVEPPFVLIENVEGMARPFRANPGEAPESVADQTVARLTEIGYTASFSVADASRFGVPQTRKRVLIFGVQRDLVGAQAVVDLGSQLEAIRPAHLDGLGLSGERPVSVWEAMHDLSGTRRIACPDSAGFEAGTYGPPESTYAKMMRSGLDANAVPDSHRFTKHGDRILELYTDAHRTQPPGRLSKSFLMAAGTKKDKKVVLDPALPSSTITTHPDEFIHFEEPRNVTVREMARLQSFPDVFAFRGRYTINGPRRRFDVARCSQVGNAVPPLLALAVGRAIESVRASLRSS